VFKKMSKSKRIQIEDIVIDESYYPRFKESPQIIESYAMAIDEKTGETELPAVTVTTDPDSGKYVLLDGYHRVSAHKRRGLKEIDAEVIKVPKEDWLWIATQLNARHGFSLSSSEKEKLAKRFFFEGREAEDIAEILGISARHVNRLIEDAREEKEAYDMERARQAREVDGLSLRKAEAKTGIPKSTIKHWQDNDWTLKSERRAEAKSESGQESSTGQEGVMPSEPLGSRPNGTLAKKLKKEGEEKPVGCKSFKGWDSTKEYEYDGCIGCSNLEGGHEGKKLVLLCLKGHVMKVDWIIRKE
jgi:ParB-like chromosome segregation protein Spo0J